MTRQTLQPSVKTSLGIVVLLVVSTTLIGEPPEPSAEAKKGKPAPDAEKKTKEQYRREAEKAIRSIDLEIIRDDKWTKVERIENPLLFYSDPTRSNDRGSVWGWGRKGRPVALLEIWQDTNGRPRWDVALCNTSGGKLRARRADISWWRENASAAELQDIPGASAPSADARLRQRQLKLLAEKFTGHEFWDPDNTKYKLRLLKRPLHTYRDEESGVLDGGLFTLTNGTNPEIVFFVEARVDPKNPSKRVWQYTVGRLAHAELHLEYDGKEVFKAPRGNQVSASNQPYWLSFFPIALDAKPRKP